MAEWVQWIIQVVAYGVICFLLKRELGQMDQRHKDLLEQIKAVEREAKADTQKAGPLHHGAAVQVYAEGRLRADGGAHGEQAGQDPGPAEPGGSPIEKRRRS